MEEQKTKKLRKPANVTTITESKEKQRSTTIPKVYCDSKNWNDKDHIEWVDTGAGLLVRKVNK